MVKLFCEKTTLAEFLPSLLMKDYVLSSKNFLVGRGCLTICIIWPAHTSGHVQRIIVIQN